MIVGDPSVFAIESRITKAYEQLHFVALGFFVVHVGRCRYGVDDPEATLLACSFGEVEDRIAGRGSHTVPFAGADAGEIARSFRSALYAEIQEESYFGILESDFDGMIHSSEIMWAPDGDEAFDDNSYILQFDVDDRVRLIAFKCCTKALYDPETLSDVWITADDFYRVLQQWHDAFESEWKSTPKTEE